MIRFACSNCNRLISVDERHSGRKGKCPKCGGVVVVPESSTIIEFACGSCGHKIRVPAKYAGRKGSCPKCQNPVVVPSLENPPSEGAGTFSILCSMCEETIQVRETSRGQSVECPECGSYIETSPGDVGDESDASVPPGADEDSYQEETEEYEESEGVDRRLIVIISAVAAVAVVGL
ncbi:MAG: TFIIB-type zinc ribbon-containing protein, partial [Planctomycetota bacterium]